MRYTPAASINFCHVTLISRAEAQRRVEWQTSPGDVAPLVVCTSSYRRIVDKLRCSLQFYGDIKENRPCNACSGCLSIRAATSRQS